MTFKRSFEEVVSPEHKEKGGRLYDKLMEGPQVIISPIECLADLEVSKKLDLCKTE